MRGLGTLLIGGMAIASAWGQFVYPRAQDNVAESGLYKEDPFITAYRKRYFAVFRGDFATFRKAHAEIKTLIAKNPRDPRALVWYGNGQTIEAGLLKMSDPKRAASLLAESRRTLDRAVALRPSDPNIYMMRAATLYSQGQYWSAKELPRTVWTTLRDDCRRFVEFLGPKRLPRVSIHIRGETFGEMGIAMKNLGDVAGAEAAFRRVIALCPDTPYEERARKEIALLDAKGAQSGAR
ncbi:hypothetical protein EON81_26630 [bacterium]|nr:MAG: hypothetical protein EON81_26630 [bacterium]